MGQQIERGLERQGLRLTFDWKAQRRHGFIEKSIPGTAGGLSLLVKKLLQLLVELVGLLFAQVVEPRLVARQIGVPQRFGQVRILDLVELQLEEDEVVRDVRDRKSVV